MRATLRRPLGVTMAAAALSFTVLGCAKDDPATSTAAESTTTTAAVNSGDVIEITSVAGKYAYEPEVQEVKVGDAVIWRNLDTTKHTVTASAGQSVNFKSPTMTTDAEFVQTFSEPGTYSYFCSIHGASKMAGTITVVP